MTKISQQIAIKQAHPFNKSNNYPYLVVAFNASYLGTHHSHFRRWPSIVEVTSHVLRVHDAVSSTISLACYYGNLRHCGFGIGIDQFGSMTDDAVVLLVRS